MASYHESATPTVTFNPYLPAIGRVLEVLRTLGPIGSTISINNRDLAAAAGLKSAGHIPRLLRTLEADGRIERITTPQGTLIVVTTEQLIPHADQPNSASGCDPESDHANPTLMRDHDHTGGTGVIPHADPPHTPLYGIMKQQQLRARATAEPATDPRIARLLRSPHMHPKLAARAVAANVGDLAALEEDLQIAAARGNVERPEVWVATLWASGVRPAAGPPRKPRAADPYANRPTPPRELWKPSPNALSPAERAAKVRALRGGAA